MITFLSSPEGVVRCRYYLEKRGRSLGQRMRPVAYDELATATGVPAGASIFSAVDQLSPAQTELATEVWNQLRDAGQRVFNHPTRSMRRYELLRTLHALGRNGFAVFRGDESSRVDRFPVFVRYADRHTGSLTPLLGDRLALERALTWLVLRGHRVKELLIVEYCDARDADGLVRKYAAFKIGDVVLAKHLLVGTSWMLKDKHRLADEEMDERHVREGQAYIHENPHEPWIREIFELARIDYGRIDYGFCEGVPQVWEINTDPTIGRPPRPRTGQRGRYRSMRKVGQDAFHRGFRAALRSLDGAEDAASIVPLRLAPELRRELRIERRREQMSRTGARVVRRFARLPAVQHTRELLGPAAGRIAPLVGRLLFHTPSPSIE